LLIFPPPCRAGCGIVDQKNFKFKSKAALSGFTNYAKSFGKRSAVSFGGVNVALR